MEAKAFDYIMHYEPTGKGLQWQVFSEPLVRCKDCKHRAKEAGFLYCYLDSADPWERNRNANDDDWFCADGEPKEENHERTG